MYSVSFYYEVLRCAKPALYVVGMGSQAQRKRGRKHYEFIRQDISGRLRTFEAEA